MRGGEQSRLKGKRILVVDADEAIRDRLRSELQSSGAAVLGPTGSAVAALELIYAELPDGALLDASLDAETSFAAAEFLWREAVPFVFFTSGAPLEMPPEFLGRSIGRDASATDIARALFGRSMSTRGNTFGALLNHLAVDPRGTSGRP